MVRKAVILTIVIVCACFTGYMLEATFGTELWVQIVAVSLGLTYGLIGSYFFHSAA